VGNKDKICQFDYSSFDVANMYLKHIIMDYIEIDNFYCADRSAN